MPFRGFSDAPRLAQIFDELAGAGGGALAFVAPPAATWPLPLYELALLAAGRLRAEDVPVTVSVVTSEMEPLGLFGPEATRRVRAKLCDQGIALYTGATVAALGAGDLTLADDRTVPADHVVALPVACARRIDGLPADREGFLVVDDHGRVAASPGVYAAGDGTASPVRQGGLACQQADAAAAAIVADLGVGPPQPAPYRPVLRGVLLSDEGPVLLRSALDDHGRPAHRWRDVPVRAAAWPSGKVVGHHLSPYLAGRADGPRTPDGAVSGAADVAGPRRQPSRKGA